MASCRRRFACVLWDRRHIGRFQDRKKRRPAKRRSARRRHACDRFAQELGFPCKDR